MSAQGLSAFDLFCAYHLGITEENTYRWQNGPQVAERLGLGLDELMALLTEHGLHPDTLVQSAFDLAAAQADVQLSPEGVDLVSVARMHWETLARTRDQPRDWAAELADED
jgi:hypothetical protein